jgi:hypothetical protein
MEIPGSAPNILRALSGRENRLRNSILSWERQRRAFICGNRDSNPGDSLSRICRFGNWSRREPQLRRFRSLFASKDKHESRVRTCSPAQLCKYRYRINSGYFRSRRTRFRIRDAAWRHATAKCTRASDPIAVSKNGRYVRLGHEMLQASDCLLIGRVMKRP